jgi:hypothetical protein
MGSRFDGWSYWHYFTITSVITVHNQGLSTTRSNRCWTTRVFSSTVMNDERRIPGHILNFLERRLSLRLMLRPTISRPVYLWINHPSGTYDQIYYCQIVAGLLMWDALSDERTGLSFSIVAGPRQRSHSQVQVPWDSRPLSQIRDFSFRRLLRLAGLRWRYSILPPHEWITTLLYVTSRRPEYRSPSQTVPLLFIRCHGNVFVNIRYHGNLCLGTCCLATDVPLLTASPREYTRTYWSVV